MNIFSDKLNCYIEGIRIPITNVQLTFARNVLAGGQLTIPLGESFDMRNFAAALVQITYIVNQKERLLYEGLTTEVVMDEAQSAMQLQISSRFSPLNNNSTGDYMSPKKYGLQKLEEGVTIFLGNEESVSVSSSEFGTDSNLSDRYFFNVSEDLAELDPKSNEANKLYYIINRMPFAERFAYSCFEAMAYQNFALSQSYIERFNLLNKVGENSIRQKTSIKVSEQAFIETVGLEIALDPLRTGLEEKYFKDAIDVSKRGCTAVDDGVVPPSDSGTSIAQSGTFGNFRDLIANDSRQQYIDFRGASPQLEQFCTPETAKAMLAAAEKIYTEFKSKLIVGDISKANPAGTDFIGTGWSVHKDHKTGTAADLYIPGATNSTTSDYDYKKSIRCLQIFFECGVRWIGWQDAKRQSELSKLSGGTIKDIPGHQNHFHCQF